MTLETSASLAVAVGRRKLRNEAVVENPEGSFTAMTLYSLVAGFVRVKRVKPRARVVGPKSTRRESSVERSASGRALFRRGPLLRVDGRRNRPDGARLPLNGGGSVVD